MSCTSSRLWQWGAILSFGIIVIFAPAVSIQVPGQWRQHQRSVVIQLSHLSRPLLVHLVNVLLSHLVLPKPDKGARGGSAQLLLEAAGSAKPLTSPSHISKQAGCSFRQPGKVPWCVSGRGQVVAGRCCKHLCVLILSSQTATQTCWRPDVSDSTVRAPRSGSESSSR